MYRFISGLPISFQWSIWLSLYYQLHNFDYYRFVLSHKIEKYESSSFLPFQDYFCCSRSFIFLYEFKNQLVISGGRGNTNWDLGRNWIELILTIMDAGKSKIKAPSWRRTSSWFIASIFSVCPHMVEEGPPFIKVGLFYKGTNPVYKGSILVT